MTASVLFLPTLAIKKCLRLLSAPTETAHTDKQDSAMDTQPSPEWLDLAKIRLDTLDRLLNSSTPDYPALKKAREQVAAELNDLARFRLGLMSRQNALQPMAVLPTELLRRIFSFASIMDPPISSSYKAARDKKASLGWIRLLHVCRHWRMIGLCHPSLWEQVCSLPRAVNSFLHRSKPMPIILTFDSSLYKNPNPHLAALQVASKKMSRVKEVSVTTFTDRQLSELIRHWCNMPAPQLRTLTLRVIGENGRHPLIHFLGDILFAKSAPNLENVCLLDCSIHWASPLLTGLRHLRMTFTTNLAPGNITPTYAQLLSALQRMPDLETLALRHSMPPSSTIAEPSSYPIVDLPKFHHLELEGDAEGCIVLMRQLRTPALYNIQLDCTSNNMVDLYQQIVGLAAARFSPLANKPINMTFTYPEHWFTFRSDHQPFASSGRIVKPRLDITMHMPGLQPQTCSSFIDFTSRSFDTTLVRNLMVQTKQVAMSKQNWLDACGQFRHVESLYLLSDTAHHFLEAMNCSIPFEDGQEPTSITDALFFARLKSLKLGDYDFLANIVGEAAWQVCYRQLESRQDISNRGIQTFSTAVSTVSEEIVRKFRTIVSAIIWDRVERRAVRQSDIPPPPTGNGGNGGPAQFVWQTTYLNGHPEFVNSTTTVLPNGVLSTSTHISVPTTYQGPYAIAFDLVPNIHIQGL
ncbi:hypothetical protein EVG20_g687 [Dentipellis fragilis]|uniref:F-box domain-containing protein n=1 Tax=Dentipellis fragilis TaxID=205917 RepID=A0A4Y9ZBY1_9AGAM|nr:hypothetical protein EVG20_g687 [Dentipellis fragilis]